MEVVADLHLHSRYSIATGRQADLEHLDLWGRYKGVQVVGTGDCTHPAWLQELQEKLAPAAPGTYELKPHLALPLKLAGPAWEAVAPVRFVVTGEVSAIYKKGGRVRKVHLLLMLSGLDAAEKLSARLGRLGNVTADGRPILGLDAKHILELTLTLDPQALVIPAHIWTPWFSVLGDKSGFDSLEECFEELTPEIYALETGLSSDPPMNWRVSGLDRFLLVSNSDAHSPQKVGREANIFLVPPTYPDLAQAIRTKTGFYGTIEFFPQEGKYHLDGHRKCGQRLAPEESTRRGGRCPACGRPLTLGVMHRVLALADREPGVPPPEAKAFESLIALPEILSEVAQANPGSKKVLSQYFQLLERLGPELPLLRRLPLAAAAREGGDLLAYAIGKMRRGEVHIASGYDGVYGEISLLSPEERRQHQGQGAFWSVPTQARPEVPEAVPGPPTVLPAQEEAPAPPGPQPDADPLLSGLNQAQRRAVTHLGAPLIVQAGPGTGKTKALTHRLAYLVERQGVPPESILALAFTRQAAQEMAARLALLLGEAAGLTVKTFHGLGHQILTDAGLGREVADEDRRRGLLRRAARDGGLSVGLLDREISRAKQNLVSPDDLVAIHPGPAAAFRAYEATLEDENLWDYEDLIARPVELLLSRPELAAAYRQSFRHLLVDEYQDLNEAQYRLFKLLAGPGAGIMVIGDPNQAIYGFRGASPRYFTRFQEDWPGAVIITFTETYRLPPPVLAASRRLLGEAGAAGAPLVSRRPGDEPVLLLEESSEKAEARAIARKIEGLLGGLSHRSLEDLRLRYSDPDKSIGFKDVAVLYRIHALGAEIEQALKEAGIPCQQAREGLGPEWDGLDLAAEKVKLLTLHAAKGLEFPYVFIAGCEAGLLPWEPEGQETAADLEEERRLFYVGLTRALSQVFLTRARRRTLRGRQLRAAPSPWVEAVAPQRPGPEARPAPRRGPAHPPLFPEMKSKGLKRPR